MFSLRNLCAWGALCLTLEAGCAAFGTAGAAVQDSPRARRGPIVVTTGPHIGTAVLTRRVDTITCSGAVIEIQVEFAQRQGAQPVSRIGRIAVEGAEIKAAVLGPVNDRLTGFEAPPRISALCSGGRVRLVLSEVGPTQPGPVHIVDLSPQ